MLKWSERLKWLWPEHTGQGETPRRPQTDLRAVGCTRCPFRRLASRGCRLWTQGCEVTRRASRRCVSARANADACVSSNLTCPFISKSQPPNDAVSGNWFPLTCPPRYRDVDMCIHSFSLLGMQPFTLALFSDYLLGVRTAQGLLFFMSSSFYSWMNRFLSSVFSYTYWKVAHSVSFF